MKRSFLLFLACFALLATSCKKTNNVVVPNETYFIDVRANDWSTSDGGRTYSASYQMPAIDADVNQNWAIVSYATFGGGVYEQLPQVYNGIAYSYTHSVGNITLETQASDGSTVITKPGAFTVKVVLIPSN
ncbi:hypothetical protein [Mucilaginibacter myungsuensis]|uniref:BACON domain-containing protein n=1 Tax=Mucilaginibacter myungsuensis TaxID=649104 RepID=A0A929PVB6_9SPHI|nr:hypothetical protein [Mucilaginibacter myungsuensis]MBE9660964.1 hypothetical protein [Mucilaginibacter myungsuensis]MDN3601010.1 hypothetical protein [Mucilaginibacter myungsuensis]